MCDAAGMVVGGESAVRVAGPWTHREITANGIRFHAVEIGSGPLILLLHGFPQFWWSWRGQLAPLAEAGFRVVAPDLRGYGGSDKPPRGYDAMTLAEDCAGMIRALGERDAIVVGTDWGGLLGWTMAAVHPTVVRRLAVLAAPHPLRLRVGLLASGSQLRAARHVLAFQTPRWAEWQLRRAGAAGVERLLHEWSGPGWPDRDAAARYRQAMLIPAAAHSALEYYRWMVRSVPRPDGVRYARAVSSPVIAPTLQVHGAQDPYLLPSTAAGSDAWVTGPYAWRRLDGVGHFPAEEAGPAVTELLLDWAGAP